MVILYRLLLVYIKDSLLHLSFVIKVAQNVRLMNMRQRISLNSRKEIWYL